MSKQDFYNWLEQYSDEVMEARHYCERSHDLDREWFRQNDKLLLLKVVEIKAKELLGE